MHRNIKKEFGKLLRQTREARRLSRAALAKRLGINPKTIQSWEMGRTFLERLDIIPILEAELDCSLSAFMAKAAGSAPLPLTAGNDETDANEAAAGAGQPAKLAVRLGPTPLRLEPAVDIPGGGSREGSEPEWLTILLVSPTALMGDLAALKNRDVKGRVAAPAEWAPRGGLLAAVRMGDSSLEPMIPLGATVILNLRPDPLEKLPGKVAAIAYNKQGLRLRRVTRDASWKHFYGASLIEHARARLRINPDKGDRIVGQAIGVMAAIR